MAMLGDEKYHAARRAKNVGFKDAALADYNAVTAQNDAAARQDAMQRSGYAVKGYNTAMKAQGKTPIADALRSGYQTVTGAPATTAAVAPVAPVGTTAAPTVEALRTGSQAASAAKAALAAKTATAAGTGAAAAGTGAAAAGTTAAAAGTGAAASGTGAAASSAGAAGPIGWIAAAIMANELGASKASNMHRGYKTNSAGEREAVTEQGRRSATNSKEWTQDAFTGKGMEEDMFALADKVDEDGPAGELLRDIGQLGNPEGTVDHIKEGFKDPKKIFDPLGFFS